MVNLVSRTQTTSGKLLPALLAIVVALLLWLLADEFKAKLPALQQQLSLAEKLAGRGPTQSLADARQAEASAKQRRADIEARLRSTESVQMTRARLGQDLRQHCAASGAQSCAVRLAEDVRSQDSARPLSFAGLVSPANPSPASPTAAAQSSPSVEALGVSKSRAVISGAFQRNELEQLTKALMNDKGAYWRINGVVVRGNTFELDVERQLIPSPPPFPSTTAKRQ